MESSDAMRVDCTECSFSEVVSLDGGVMPADIAIEHGQERGHKLSVEPLEEQTLDGCD